MDALQGSKDQSMSGGGCWMLLGYEAREIYQGYIYTYVYIYVYSSSTTLYIYIYIIGPWSSHHEPIIANMGLSENVGLIFPMK